MLTNEQIVSLGSIVQLLISDFFQAVNFRNRFWSTLKSYSEASSTSDDELFKKIENTWIDGDKKWGERRFFEYVSFTFEVTNVVVSLILVMISCLIIFVTSFHNNPKIIVTAIIFVFSIGYFVIYSGLLDQKYNKIKMFKTGTKNRLVYFVQVRGIPYGLNGLIFSLSFIFTQ